MLHFQPQFYPVLVDSFKPGIQTRVQFDFLARNRKVLAAQRGAVLHVFLLQEVQVGTDRVHGLVPAHLADLSPELRCIGIPEGRDQAVFLHILRAQCFVKIIQNRCLFHV